MRKEGNDLASPSLLLPISVDQNVEVVRVVLVCAWRIEALHSRKTAIYRSLTATARKTDFTLVCAFYLRLRLIRHDKNGLVSEKNLDIGRNRRTTRQMGKKAKEDRRPDEHINPSNLY